MPIQTFGDHQKLIGKTLKVRRLRFGVFRSCIADLLIWNQRFYITWIFATYFFTFLQFFRQNLQFSKFETIHNGFCSRHYAI